MIITVLLYSKFVPNTNSQQIDYLEKLSAGICGRRTAVSIETYGWYIVLSLWK